MIRVRGEDGEGGGPSGLCYKLVSHSLVFSSFTYTNRRVLDFHRYDNVPFIISFIIANLTSDIYISNKASTQKAGKVQISLDRKKNSSPMKLELISSEYHNLLQVYMR